MELSWLRKQTFRIVLVAYEENIDIVCINEFKKLRKRFAYEKKLVVTETKTSSYYGSVIIAKKGINVRGLRPITSKKNTNEQAVEIIGVNLETPISFYFSLNQDLNFNQIFDSNLEHAHLWRFQFSSSSLQLYIQHGKRRKIAGNIWWRNISIY